MNLLKQSALAASLSLALCGWANAASLGQLQVISQADQNFQATFQVHDVSPTGGSLTARLAPAKTYEQYRVTMPESAKGLKLALINKNPLTLRISGDRPAQERSFPLLVELNEAGKVSVSRYNIFIGASGSVEPVAVNAGPAPISTATPVTAAASAPTQAPAPAVKAAPTKVQTTVAKDESTMTPLERMRARNYDLNKPVVVEPGYTPWSLGVLYQSRYPQATVNQVLVALAIHNPNAFPNDDVRSLRAGASLMAPPASLVNSIDQNTAKRIVQKGLSISDVAKEPAPIAKRPVHKAEPVKAKKPEPKVETIPTVEPKPVETKPEPKPEPVPEVKAPETAPVETMPPVTDAQQPAATPATEPLPSTEPLPVTEQAPDLTQNEGDTASAQEVMPTLEIMTEEEVVPQEEETSWLWYVLIVVLLGAAGFIYWRTKQGKQVDFEAVKSVINRSRMSRYEEEPTQSAGPVEPTMGTTQAAPQTTAQSAPQTQMYSHPAKAEPVRQVPPTASAGASNVFDLVSEELPLNDEPTVKELSQPAAAQTTAPKQEASSMSDSLAMARSFVAIGAKDEAIQLLQEVLQKGSPADRAEAQLMLRQIHNQAS